MKFNIKKEATILFLIMVFAVIFITSTNFALAQDQGSCCVLSSGQCSIPTNEVTCVGGTLYPQACTDVDACQNVCCEYQGGCDYIGQAICQADEGVIIQGIDNENDCVAICSNGYTIQGNVIYNDDEQAAGVIVSFTSSEMQKNVTTNAQGSFSIVLPAGTYNVIAYADNCVSSSILFTVSANQVMETIILPCSLVEDCISIWTTTPWSDGNCGTRTATENPPGCVHPNNQPILFLPCESTTCGNGEIEAGEDCEFEPLRFRENQGTCEDKHGPNFYGVISCSYQCRAIENCIECPDNVNDCTDASMCNDECEECADAPICQEQCLATEIVSPFTATAGYRNDKKLIDVSWEIPDLCESSTITLTRCRANEAIDNCSTSQGTFQIENFISLPGSATTWADTNFRAGNAYCYNISVSVTTGFEQFTIGPEKLACAKLWDDRCLDVPNGVHCEGDDLVTCALGVVVEDATEECKCACIDATLFDEAYCLGQEGDGPDTPACNICGICSGPFGLFPYQNYKIKDIYNSNVYVEFCSDVLYLKQCYLDDYSRNKAVIGEYKSCSEISSCYDYKTSQSCEDNPCSILKIDMDECKWNSFSVEDELGIGVCMPTNVTSQDCTMCNTNNILGNYCPQELCELYGQDAGESTCFYNENQKYRNTLFDNFSCMNKDHVACETYDSQDLCIGANNKNFSVYVRYNDESKRTGINNTYAQLSDDYLKRGKCIWVQGACERDADGSRVTGSDEPDCGSDACFLDFTNPNTTLFIFDKEIVENNKYSKSELLELSAIVSEDAKTYYMLTASSTQMTETTRTSNLENPTTPPTRNIYPTLDKIKLNQLINELVTNKSYILSYYSEDRAKNLEFVQRKEIFLLNGLDDIKVVYELFSAYYQSADIYLTNMTVSIDYDNELTCKVNLTDIAGNEGPFLGDATKTGSNLEWNYNYLLDGIYQIKTTCIDNHFQTYSNITDVRIDADITLHNASPRGETFRAGDVPISIESIANATCHYTFDASVEEFDSPVWVEYDITGEKLHESNITDDYNGIKQIYTGCLMKYVNLSTEWYMGNNGDIIYYAIDEIAPQSILYDVYAQEIYDNSIVKDSLSLQIFCDDYDPILEAERNYSFGCTNEIVIQKFYVNYTNQNQVIYIFPQEIISNGEIVDFAIPPYYARIWLNVTVQDMGGNNNTITQFINVRNLSFLEPIAIICDETGICQ